MSDLARNYPIDTVPTMDDSEEQHEVLRRCLRSAAKSSPRFPDFIVELKSLDIAFVCKLTRTGRVSSIKYVLENGMDVKASSLGDEFTWTGLQRKLGVEYVQIRDYELLTSLVDTTATPSAQRNNTSSEYDALLVERIEQLEHLEKRLIEKLDEAQLVDMAQVTKTIEMISKQTTVDAQAVASDSAPNATQVVDAVERLEVLAQSIQQQTLASPDANVEAKLPSDLEEELRHTLVQMKSVSQRALSDSSKTMQRAEYAANKIRQESFWLAVVSSLISAFVAALLTGLWITQETEKSLEANRQAMVEQLQQFQEDDPLRAYFQKIMDSMP